MSKLTYQLSLYPDYLADRMGLDFSARYHTDPVYRNEKWKDILQWVYKKFGKWGCGDASPGDSYSAATLGSVHLLSYLFGSPVSYGREQFPETPVYPLCDLQELMKFDRKAAILQERLDELLKNTEMLIDRYGRENVGIPFFSPEMDGVEDLENTHCPLTIAYKLFGDRILLEIYDDPEGVKFVFREIMQMCREIAGQFRNLLNLPKPRHVLMSACSACFVSPAQWEEFLLPLQEEYLYGREVFFHSCGNINNHLMSFGKLSQKVPFIKFDCRESSGADIRKAAVEMPGVEISYMFSPVLCLSRSAAEMKKAVEKVVKDAGESPLHLILMAPKGTEDPVIEAYLQTCTDVGSKKANPGFRFV